MTSNYTITKLSRSYNGYEPYKLRQVNFNQIFIQANGKFGWIKSNAQLGIAEIMPLPMLQDTDEIRNYAKNFQYFLESRFPASISSYFRLIEITNVIDNNNYYGWIAKLFVTNEACRLCTNRYLERLRSSGQLCQVN